MEITLEDAISRIQDKYINLVTGRTNYDAEKTSSLRLAINPEVIAVALAFKIKNNSTIEKIISEYKSMTSNEEISIKAYRTLGLMYLASGRQTLGELALECSFQKAFAAGQTLTTYTSLRQKAQEMANCMIEAAEKYTPVTGNINEDIKLVSMYYDTLVNNELRKSKVKLLD